MMTNFHTFDNLIVNEDLHTYHLGDKNLIPVTTLIKDFAQEFDSQTISARVAKKRGVSQQEVLDEWDRIKIDAQDFGHQVHKFGERYGRFILSGENKPIVTCPEEKALAKFFTDLHPRFLPVTFEQKMYSVKYGYAGTTDIIFYDGKKGFVICDYKTGKDIHRNYYGQMMLPPFQYLLDTPFNHYQLQLSLYQIPLEENGLFVSERWVVWVKPDGTYQKLNTNDFSVMLRQHIAA